MGTMGVLSTFALAAVQLLGLAVAQITVNAGSPLHTIDGFGVSQAFGRASQFQSAAAGLQKQALDYLFSTTTGAGFSIIRNRIGSGGSGDSIEPKNPGSPTATPKYTWDNNDSGQVWFSKQAMSYGVKTIYADAWSAPGFMKTNGAETNGGYLCGTTGHTCSSGDWRQAFAKFLVEYIQDYAGAGVPVTHIGFLNEPDYTTSYSSMLISNNAQEAISFIPTLRTALDSANLKSVQIACCDATGWPRQTTYTQALMSADMQNYLGVISSHTYSGFPTSPMNTPLRTWITEGCPEGHPFVKTWYSSGGVTEGMTYANYLAQGFVNANLSAWVFWEGFEINEQSSESHLLDTSGSNVEPSGIFWAFVMWSRWIRPNARRLSLSGSVSGVLSFAAQNTDGSVVVVLTNSGSSSASPSISFTGFSPTGAQAWVTSNSQTTASTNAKLSGSSVSVSVPGHGVVTVKLTSS